MQCTILWLAFFIQCNNFAIRVVRSISSGSHFSAEQPSIVRIHQIFILPAVDVCLSCFSSCLLWVMMLKIFPVSVFLWTYVVSPLGNTLCMGLLGHMVGVCWVFKETASFLKWEYHFIFPPAVYANTCFISLFSFRHSSRCLMWYLIVVTCAFSV